MRTFAQKEKSPDPAAPARTGEHRRSSLTVNVAGDRWEREAERVADAVTAMPEPRAASEAVRAGSGLGGGLVARVPARAPAESLGGEVGGGGAAPPVVAETMRAPGRPLDPTVREALEPRFGHDFGRVRIHADERSARAARAIGARAFTVGSHIAFGAGEYRPGTPAGRRLLSHELTHVLQQAGSGPRVQRFTAYDKAKQAGGSSLGWQHPGAEDLRVSDDGLMAVEDKGWNPGTNKRAWTTKAKVAESNAKLNAVGSNAKLAEKAGTISGKPPADPKAGAQTLVEIEPQKAVGGGAFSLISDCGHACRQVMGSAGGKDVAVVGQGGKETYTTARTYHGGSPTTPEEFFEEILRMEFGAALSRADLYDAYSKLTAAKKDAFDRKYGINEYAVPEVGQGQTISTESDMPGFATAGPSTWNFHYAATVVRSGPDHVTLESAAGWGATDWIFYMYGPARKAQSFHEEHGAMGSHGTHYTTMVVQPAKRLEGTTNAAGVHLVGDPANWSTTLIVKLPKGTKVRTLRKTATWREVTVEAGPHAGKTGWIMDHFFTE